jgi:hypothetical protein
LGVYGYAKSIADYQQQNQVLLNSVEDCMKSIKAFVEGEEVGEGGEGDVDPPQ